MSHRWLCSPSPSPASSPSLSSSSRLNPFARDFQPDNNTYTTIQQQQQQQQQYTTTTTIQTTGNTHMQYSNRQYQAAATGVSPLFPRSSKRPLYYSNSHSNSNSTTNSTSTTTGTGAGIVSGEGAASPTVCSPLSLSVSSLSPALSALSISSTASDSPLLSSLPSLPFDVPSDSSLLNERPDHAAYMFGFRVCCCQDYLLGVCPYDSYTCFHAHSKTPRRRKPILHHGRFNYIPTRCRYLLEDRECPQGVHCRFAHVTEEVIYHPSKYKTQLCSHAVDSKGCCTGYGQHCAKAHGEADRRQPIYETEEQLQGMGQQIIQPRYTMDNFYEFQCPEMQREQERKFYMFVYKTRRCVGFPWNCNCDGLDYHRDEERRRGPEIRYAPMACPNVKPYLNAEWGDPNVDCSGRFKHLNEAAGRVVEWDCEYAHTLLELMYHPNVYKSSLCDHFDEHVPSTWRCVWKRRCAHAHGKADLRMKEEAAEEWKQHLLLIGSFNQQQTSPLTLAQTLQPAAATHTTSGVTTASTDGSYSTNLQTNTTQTRYTQQQARATANTSVVAVEKAGYVFSCGSPSPLLSDPTWAEQTSGTVSPGAISGETRDNKIRMQTATGQPPKRRLSLFDLSAAIPSSPSSSHSSVWNSAAADQQTLGREELILSGRSHSERDTSPFSVSSASPWPATANTPSSHSVLSVPAEVAFDGRSPSPSFFPTDLLSGEEAGTSVNDTGMIPVTLDESLSYDPIQMISLGRDGAKMFAGLSSLVGHCAVKVIMKQGHTAEWCGKVRRDVDLLVGRSQHSPIPHFVQYIDQQEDGDKIAIAIQLHPEERPMNELNTHTHTEAHAFQPIQLIKQLLSAIQSLHAMDIIHGDITPKNISIDPRLQLLRLGDIARIQEDQIHDTAAVSPSSSSSSSSSVHSRTSQADNDGLVHTKPNEDRIGMERRSCDVYAAGCVSYYLLSSGRTPFKQSNIEFDSWQEAALASPLDTSMLTPTATHFILHLLFTQMETRMSAQTALKHPLFWSQQQAMKFLTTVEQFINTHKQQRDGDGDGEGDSQTSKQTEEKKSTLTESQSPVSLPVSVDLSAEVTAFCSELDALSDSILPVPHLPAFLYPINSSQTPRGEWATNIHNSLYQRHLGGVGKGGGGGGEEQHMTHVDTHSVVSLLHFISASVNHLLHAPLLSCLVHTLFRLDHRPNCTRPRRMDTARMNGQQKQVDDEAIVLSAVADYFLPRFPSLLISVFHLIQQRFRQQTEFQPFFTADQAEAEQHNIQIHTPRN